MSKFPLWSCHLCGKTFRSAVTEARHRHNAPLLCRGGEGFRAAFRAAIDAERRAAADRRNAEITLPKSATQ